MATLARRFKPTGIFVGVLLACSSNISTAVSAWDPSSPTQVRLASIVLGDVKYSDLVVTFGDLVGFSTTGPTRTYNSYNLANGHLTIGTLAVGSNQFYNVVVTVTGVTSIAGQAALSELVPNDPLFASQWHLKNTGQSGASGDPAKAGEDLNVGKAWQLATGTGIQIAVVDDGLIDLTIVPDEPGDDNDFFSLLTTALSAGREAALEQIGVCARMPWLEVSAEQPFTLNLDGEPMQASSFRIEAVPARLQMHLPPTSPLLSAAGTAG